MCDAELLRQHVQPLVQCPQSGALRDQGRGEQVHICDAAAEAEQVFAVDETQHFRRTGLTGGLHAGEVGQCSRATRWGAANSSAPARVRGMSGMSGWFAPSSASRLADCTMT